jgi:hypothetical protein
MYKKLSHFSIYLGAWLVSSPLFAQVCDPQDQACLTAPEGILRGSAKASDAVNLLNWLLFSASMVGAISFGMKAAKRMSDEQWFGALGPGLGAVTCGITTYVAYSIIK